MNQIKIFASFIVLMGTLVFARAQDWPQYLGPDRDSSSEQKGILRAWPEAGPEVLWSVEVGPGFGGPVIKEGRVYLLDRDDEVGDILRCFELSSGKEIWNFSYEAPGTVMFPGSRSIPTVEGDYIYSCGHNGDLYCLDINSHTPVWNKNIWKDFGGEDIPRWAITQNPLIYGDLLILAAQTPEVGVVAYDKHSGDVKWTTPSLGQLGYVSPSLLKVNGENHLVMVTAAAGRRGEPGTGGKVVGIEPLSGKILWEYSNWQCRIPVASAYDAGEGRALITGGYEAGSSMIQIAQHADGSYEVKELYKIIDFGTHTKPPVLYKGYFYAQYTTNERRDGLVCMSLDGQIMWKTGREPSFSKGSMIQADGLILATDGEKKLYLIEPDPNAFKPLASVELLVAESSEDGMAARFGTQNWAPMALAEGKLLVRDQGRLRCVKVTE